MGIPSQVARLILREHRFRPITGELLSIGRQIVHLTPEQAISLVSAELGTRLDIDPQSVEVDTSTRSSLGRNLISDRAFFSLFTDARYHCLDQSDYEGADIIFDLCNPNLAVGLVGNFDFIYGGSTLDNVFDPAAALRNLAQMARPGGRLFHVNRASRIHNVYLAFSLSWFYDYYGINQFNDCQIYLAQWDQEQTRSRWDLYHFRPLQERDGLIRYFGEDTWYFPWRHGHAIILAEKGGASTWDKNPIQFEFRSDIADVFVDENFETIPQPAEVIGRDPYAKAALCFSRSRRPLVVRPDEKVALAPEFIDYAPQIVYCGSIDPVPDPSVEPPDQLEIA